MPRLLDQARQMELDGRDIYLDSARRARSELVRELFVSLAADEEAHASWLQELARQGDPVIVSRVPLEDRMKSILARPASAPESNVADVLERAIELEKAAIAMYQDLKGEVACSEHRPLVELIVEQEYEHLVALRNVHHYLTRPGAWFDESESVRWNWMNT